MTLSYGSQDFVASLNGAVVTSHPLGETTSTVTQSNEEFDRFSDLAKKLVEVPKTELDEKLKGES